MRAGCQQRDARIFAACMLGEGDLNVLEELGEAHTVTALEDVAGYVGVHDPVGDCKADTRKGFGVTIDDAPGAVFISRKVGRVEAQRTGGGEDVLARAQI